MEKSRSWPSAHDWKSCIPQKGIEGSNPSFSAIENPGIRKDTGVKSILFNPGSWVFEESNLRGFDSISGSKSRFANMNANINYSESCP